MQPRDIFLAKLTRRPTPRPATGSATSVVTADLMAKVGTHFPTAHLDAEAMAALAGAGHTEIGFDNVMPLFSVWHESAALGCRVDWGDDLRMPACHEALCADIEDEVRIPPDLLNRPPCAVALQALRLLRRRLGSEVAIVGKVFGPWTLGYHVFGIENFLVATILNPDALRRALRALVEVTVSFANAQVDAGADAITLGDHCTRDLCSPADYQRFLQEIHEELHARIRCPLILHICGDTADRIPMIRRTGVECFHFDSKVTASQARALAGEKLALMGGTSNLDIVLRGTSESIFADVADKIAAGVDIIGPECAVPLDAPYAHLRRLAQSVRGARSEG